MGPRGPGGFDLKNLSGYILRIYVDFPPVPP